MMTTPKQEYHIKTNKLAKLFCAPILLITKASVFHIDATSWLKCLSSSGWRDLNPRTAVWEVPSCCDSKIVNYLRTQSDERSLFSVDAEYRQYVRQHFSQLFPAFHHRRSCLLPRSLDGREFFSTTLLNGILFYSKETSPLRHLRSVEFDGTQKRMKKLLLSAVTSNITHRLCIQSSRCSMASLSAPRYRDKPRLRLNRWHKWATKN